MLVAASFGQPVEWLAIAGGAAVGAFVFGLAAQLLCRATTGKKLPPFPLLTVRILGGVVAGVLTAMCVLSGGGNGLWPFGGPGGPGDHTGPTANSDQKPRPADARRSEPHPARHTADKEIPTPAKPENTMRVEVLTAGMLDEPARSQALAERRHYRLPDSTDSKALHTLEEVEDAIQKRRDKNPPLQLLSITGPDQGAGWVAPLKDWAEERHIKVRTDSVVKYARRRPRRPPRGAVRPAGRRQVVAPGGAAASRRRLAASAQRPHRRSVAEPSSNCTEPSTAGRR